MEFKTKKRNTSIAILIRNYQNKKGGKVIVSRNEIKERFDFLDWKDQRNILMAFLQSGKTDRLWASKKLIHYWDPCFEPIVKELWEGLHEECLTWPIIRFFPKEYLRQNLDSLSKGRNYYFLCLRFSGDDSFDVDEDKLGEIDLLNYFYKVGRTLTDEHIIRLFYTLVSKLCTNDFGWIPFAKWPTTYFSNEIPSIFDIQMIQMVRNTILKLNKKELYEKMLIWNYNVHRAIEESEDFRNLQSLQLSKEIQELDKLALTKRFYYNHLDKLYKFKGEDPKSLEQVFYYCLTSEDSRHFMAEDEVLPF